MIDITRRAVCTVPMYLEGLFSTETGNPFLFFLVDYRQSYEPKTAAIGKKSCRESTCTEFEENTAALPTRRYTFSSRGCTTY